MARVMPIFVTHSWCGANGGWAGGLLFIYFNGAKYSKGNIEVGRSIYLMVICHSAGIIGVGSEARIAKFCA
jgi:hypothetical protein